MSSGLTKRQLSNLVRLFDDQLGSVEFDVPADAELEVSYTSRIVRPMVEEWTAQLRRPDLLVRGDGGLNPPRALVVESLTFYPDVEVAATGQRYLAVEVKFLRVAQDPTGAFAKALGQATIYREMGFASSHAIIIDLRPLSAGVLPPVPQWRELQTAGVHVHWFKRKRGAEHLLTRVRREQTVDGL